MKTKTTIILVLAFIAVGLAAGFLFWEQLPEQMASHWNVNDEADGYTSKFLGVFLMPLVALGLFGLFITLPNIDPLKANIEEFRGAFNLFIVLMIAFMMYVHALTLVWNLGYQNFKFSQALVPSFGALFIFIGYMLKQAKRNFFIGIRTPWTLSSDSVWDKTHRLGGNLFMLAGVFALVASFFGGAAAFWLMFVPLIASVLFLVIYSYILYRSETKA